MIGLFKSKVVPVAPDRERSPSPSELTEIYLLDFCRNFRPKSAEAQKLATLIPAIIKILKVHEDSKDLGSAAIKQRMIMRVFHRATDQSSAPLQVDCLVNSTAYDFFVEQVLTGHIFKTTDSRQSDMTTASGKFCHALKDYIQNSFNNLLVSFAESPYPIDCRLNSLSDCFALSNTPITHHNMLFHLIRAPDFNPKFFKEEHRHSLLSCLRGLREGYHALRFVFEEDCDYLIRSQSKAINHLLEQSTSDLQMQNSTSELNQSWEEIASKANEHLLNPYIFIESSPCSGRGKTVSQGEVAILDVDRSNYGLRTFGAQNCVILAALIYSEEKLSKIALAHIDPQACPKSISKIIGAINKMGQAKFAVVGGGLFNSFRISQLLESTNSDYKTFLSPPKESRYSALHSLSAELSKEGKLTVYADPAGAQDRKRSIAASDYQRLWDLDRSICWLAD